MTRLMLLPMLLAPLAMNAQAPQRYRAIATSTDLIDSTSFAASLVSFRTLGIDVAELEKTKGALVTKSTSRISVTTTDSAGGTIWQLVEDSLYVELPPSGASRMTAEIVPPKSSAPSAIYRIFVRNGVPVAMQKDGKPARVPIDTLHPAASLQVLLPGLSFLIPTVGFPAKLGEVNSDTLTSRTFTYGKTIPVMRRAGTTAATITMITTEVTSTTVFAWRRAARDTLEATQTNTKHTNSATSRITNSTSGISHVMLDGLNQVRQITMSMTVFSPSQATTTGGANPSKSTTLIGYSLVRIP